VIYVRFRG